ncbi:hypothetical protein ABUK73_16930 [Agrobacterium sp. BA1120]|uniref:hypothetical protein n=1 Tax=Agrobacterium sp. BA1120 TaxID=3228927 RepID=UPI00336A2C97
MQSIKVIRVILAQINEQNKTAAHDVCTLVRIDVAAVLALVFELCVPSGLEETHASSVPVANSSGKARKPASGKQKAPTGLPPELIF